MGTIRRYSASRRISIGQVVRVVARPASTQMTQYSTRLSGRAFLYLALLLQVLHPCLHWAPVHVCPLSHPPLHPCNSQQIHPLIHSRSIAEILGTSAAG